MTGQQLKEHLQKCGIAQAKLAHQMRVCQSTISNYTRKGITRDYAIIDVKRALRELGHPFEEPKPSTFGTSETDHTTLVRLTDLQSEVNTLRELVNSQKRIITLLEEKLERSLPNLA